jgi:hypothetical protein
MSRKAWVLNSVSVAAIVVFSAAAQDSPKAEFTARELFYASAKAEKPAAEQPAKPPSPKQPAVKSNATPPKPVQVQVDSSNKQAPKPSTGGELPGGGHVIQAVQKTTAPAPASGSALGLKYTILKLVNGDMVEVPPDTVFHAGDRIRFNVETNGPGYLYIISQGSSGTWKPMFPSAEVEDGNNHIEGFHSYTMPPKSRLAFDTQAGTELVFLVLSRSPEPDLEQMIYSLQGGKVRPVSQPGESTRAHTLVASAAIDNQTVGHLREAYARDLIVEAITENTPGDRKEKSIYVVNPTGSSDSRVVADLALVHQ